MYKKDLLARKAQDAANWIMIRYKPNDFLLKLLLEYYARVIEKINTTEYYDSVEFSYAVQNVYMIRRDVERDLSELKKSFFEERLLFQLRDYLLELQKEIQESEDYVCK